MIYVIVGPTACGKTDVAHKLAATLLCPIINADAFQIYKDMDIGTNKISKSDPLYISYHLLDIVSPSESYSVKQYQENAREVLNNVLSKYDDVIIVGGTGLYIKALLYDYSFADEQSDSIDDDLLEMNNEQLFEVLKTLDLEESKKIHVNNRKRLLRAIMLIRNNNETKTDMLAKQSHKLIYKDVNICFINPNREDLYNRINQRVTEMIDKGLIDEVKTLTNKYKLSITASQAIGYKEIISYLNNDLSLADAIELIQKRSRNYAKRQITFFLHQFENVKIFSSKEETTKFLIKK